MKRYNGKAIYNPSGKAGEYAEWACNFYVGCSNGCEYCYCKKGILSGAMGQDEPQLKKCFRDEEHALDIFKREVEANLPDLRRYGLFFSFTTDPMLDLTMDMTLFAVEVCLQQKIPVKILTKNAENIMWCFLTPHKMGKILQTHANRIAIGFTLTGHDELEPHASTNEERIETMKLLNQAGYRTFASIEPIIDFNSAVQVIEATRGYCNLYKIGLLSGKKYNKVEVSEFVQYCNYELDQDYMPFTVYYKDSLLKAAGIERRLLPDNCVNRDYNLFL